jgi:hypothetical protein
MPYKEQTIDYLLGRELRTGAIRWRVLEYRPKDFAVRLCFCEDEAVRSVVDWRILRQQIADGTITVE